MHNTVHGTNTSGFLLSAVLLQLLPRVAEHGVEQFPFVIDTIPSHAQRDLPTCTQSFCNKYVASGADVVIWMCVYVHFAEYMHMSMPRHMQMNMKMQSRRKRTRS